MITINIQNLNLSISTVESKIEPSGGTTLSEAGKLQPGQGDITLPDAGKPWPGQGGIYICTLPAQFGLPARHLVVGTSEAEELTWGPCGEEAPGATSQTDGRANTAALIASGKGHPAAVWASQYTEDGHADYYLPSRIELLMCYLHAPQVFQTSGWYWSSSQYSRNLTWYQDFEYGDSGASTKYYEFRVRPVRSIQL